MHFIYGFRNLNFATLLGLLSFSLFFALFGTPFEHFRPTFRTQGMDDLWKPLVRASESRTSIYLTIIQGITSWWTHLTLYRIFLHAWDSVPDGSN